MEFLKEILGEELYGQVEEKINAHNSDQANKEKQIKIVNVASGNYVGKEKFEAKETEVAGLKQQLTDANQTIKSYEDMNVDEIKQSAKNWEEKYNTDTANLKKELADKEYGYNLDLFINTLKMNDDVHKANLKREIQQKELKFEGNKLIGGDDVVAAYKEQYPNVFVSENDNKTPAFVNSAKGPETNTKAGKDMTYEDYCKIYPMK